MAVVINLPALPNSADREIRDWADALKSELEATLSEFLGAVARYTVTNISIPPSRALDASAATLAQTREVLAALITDLQTKGVLTI